MSQKKKEYLIGVLLGLLIGLMFFHKLCFGQTVTANEVELLARVSQAEAGNQSVMGRRLVVATVINRTEHEAFPDSIEAVLAQEGQFTTYKHLSSVQATPEDYTAVYQELNQTCNSNVLFFQRGGYGCGDPLMQYEDHYFSTLAD